MKKIYLKQNAGFTLLETLIAIFIMVVAFTSLLSLMTTTMFSARYANNEITATYLAQEAVDYIRNDRDTTAFQGGIWLNFLAHYGSSLGTPSGCFVVPDGCYFDVTDTTYSNIKQCNNPPTPFSCPYFNYEESPTSGGYYKYDATFPKTNFKRTVTMELNGTDEVLITVRIDWSNGSKARSQTLRASVLKWK